ncbi:MAG: thiamine/thiamine pyrophosphate ABC transporter permease ThiP, partial [Pseudomonadota bacterium]
MGGLGGGFSAADLRALRFTALQATLSAALSVAFAVPVARALARRRFPGRALATTVLGAPFLLPVIVAVIGVIAVWGRSGWVSELSMALGG